MNNKTRTSKYFEYKTKKVGMTPNSNSLNTEVVGSLKYLSNFWFRSLRDPLVCLWLTMK